MISMQNEDALECAHQHLIGHIILGRRGEHHVQEIFHIAEFVLGIHERIAVVIFVCHRRDGRHLAQQAHRRQFAVFRIVDIQRVVIKGRKRPDHAYHHRHRMSIAPETIVEPGQLVMHHGVRFNLLHELGFLCGIGQLSVQQQITDFQKIGLFG